MKHGPRYYFILKIIVDTIPFVNTSGFKMNYPGPVG